MKHVVKEVEFEALELNALLVTFLDFHRTDMAVCEPDVYKNFKMLVLQSLESLLEED